MSVEIERKFLVNKKELLPFLQGSVHKKELVQGYLAYTSGGTTVRVRTARTEDEHRGAYLEAWVTIKGVSKGISRPEFEWPLSYFEAQEMLKSIPVEGCLVSKTRYAMTLGEDHQKWEIDFFHGENEGLIIAEAELPSEGYALALPSFILSEVSGDFRYTNVHLSKRPYRTWPHRSMLIDAIRGFALRLLARFRA